jgi:NADH dehydrogenase [ubiquinone] 1 alpha subcomplex assembly factor 2
MRRIVQYPRQRSVHYSDVSSQISPAWHQWLRHTRRDPPSLQEQQQDLVRQEQLKVLAAQADARWAEKPSYLDAPGREGGQPVPALRVNDPGGYNQETRPDNQAPAPATTIESTFPSPNSPIETQTPDIPRHPLTGRAQRVSESTADKQEKEKEKDDPWKKHARGGPSEEWQPQAWDPSSLAARR